MIKIHIASTPNGRKPIMALEEIGAAYEALHVNLAADEQRSDGFLALNPNHKIPVLEDEGTVVWESGAILLYLGETYDPKHRILPGNARQRWQAIQYAFFQTGGLGPNLGRLSTQLQRPEGERNMEMVRIFADEVDRLIGVLDRILSDDREYLVGDYSIADIMHYPWLQLVLALAAPQLMNRPRVVEWLCRIADRPATKRAYAVA